MEMARSQERPSGLAGRGLWKKRMRFNGEAGSGRHVLAELEDGRKGKKSAAFSGCMHGGRMHALQPWPNMRSYFSFISSELKNTGQAEAIILSFHSMLFAH